MGRPHICRPVTPELLEAFERRLAKIKGGVGECWPWSPSAERNIAYGRVSRVVDGKFTQALAHRVSMTSHLGRALADSEIVMHKCDNKPCVNPAHLEIGTDRVNQIDSYARGARPRRTHCKRGHEFVPGSYWVVTTPSGRPARKCIECNRVGNRERYRRRKRV